MATIVTGKEQAIAVYQRDKNAIQSVETKQVIDDLIRIRAKMETQPDIEDREIPKIDF